MKNIKEILIMTGLALVWFGLPIFLVILAMELVNLYAGVIVLGLCVLALTGLLELILKREV